MSDARVCRHCGALNEASFDRCIRCARSLGGSAATAAPAPSFSARRPRIFAIFDGERLLATKGLIALTLLIFGGQVLSAIARGNTDTILFGSNPLDDFRFGALRFDPEVFVFHPAWVMRHEPWRLLSAVFVHFGLIHFGFNMMGLAQLGRQAEAAIGSGRFTILYVVTGVVGFVTSTVWVLLTGAGAHSTAGASGAIFGVFGLFVGVLLRWRDPRWKPIAIQAGFYVLLSAALFPANNAAHIGGVLAGAAVGALFAPRIRQPQRVWEIALGALCYLACIGALVAAQRSEVLAAILRSR